MSTYFINCRAILKFHNSQSVHWNLAGGTWNGSLERVVLAFRLVQYDIQLITGMYMQPYWRCDQEYTGMRMRTENFPTSLLAQYTMYASVPHVSGISRPLAIIQDHPQPDLSKNQNINNRLGHLEFRSKDVVSAALSVSEPLDRDQEATLRSTACYRQY